VIIRRGEIRDAAAISRIEVQTSSDCWDYLRYECTVADVDGAVVAYLLTRKLADDEFEIVTLAVLPELQRSGIAESLIRAQLNENKGKWFLEVRESNLPARLLYAKVGFEEVGRRSDYYSDPPEPAVVMSFRSC